jgi:hypothetical protein
MGRVLRPPPESVTPVAPELHPDLTTRERVELQTSQEACQSCHGLINPLGFALEHFDAIGRYRQVEKDELIDATGSYLQKSGEVANFDGVRELAEFLVKNDETQEAFVRQLFHHTVKQPINAYGKNSFPALKQAFVEHEFSIARLLMEIVATSAMQRDE